jgi:hypothetical protein
VDTYITMYEVDNFALANDLNPCEIILSLYHSDLREYMSPVCEHLAALVLASTR